MVTWETAFDSGEKDRGNVVLAYRNSTVGPCAFVPGSEAEATQGAYQVTALADIYIPAGTPVTPQDRVIMPDGQRWQVVGQPNSWKSPFTGFQAPVQVRLRRVTGASAHTAVNSAIGGL
jgi:hypothetical protein